MSDVQKLSEFEEANKISKQIDSLKTEILTIKIKGGERALRMKAIHVQRIEDLNKKIKELTYRRNLLVRTVQRIHLQFRVRPSALEHKTKRRELTLSLRRRAAR